MAALPRLLDDQDGCVYLDLGGACFAVDTETRRICWSDPLGPSLLSHPAVRAEVGGPATYGHIDLYYDGDWAPKAYTLRAVEDLNEGDLVTWEGCVRTVKNTAPGRHGKVDIFVDHPSFTGPYPRDPQDLVPLHPPS
ncbi:MULTISPECIES: hypothetical protein [Streptomyces]|uniref:hypothetical protein n=1 Tax=Streptomyces TaxID=1883 RepID=UPI000E69354B|nr:MULTISPECIES: hypothetical protein [Streptomyces]MDX3066390.1 hypothetical protein [Streptomyces sp. ND04-05B]MDX3519450.1 hypothetical protein [Streptomyces scabiei]